MRYETAEEILHDLRPKWPTHSAKIEYHLKIPLWSLFLAGVLPTLILWFRDRPRKGHCRHCGYNLTGNLSGRCPKCGSAVMADSSRKGRKA